MARHLDVVVIGAGPSGLTAARVVAAAGLSCLVVDKMGPGGQLMNMGAVHEYPGLDPGITGPDLLGKLLDEAMAAGAELAVDEVTRLQDGAPWQLSASEAPLTATAVVIATGVGRGTLAIGDEELFEGLGISYCATCDGPLFAGQRVVVDGSDDWAVQEAIELAGIAGHVTLITRNHDSVAPPRVAEILALANVDLVRGRVVAIAGDPSLDKIVVDTGLHRVTLAATGLFPCDGRQPAAAFLDGLLDTTASGHVLVGPDAQASLPGTFACGDVASPVQRIAMAIADGEKAGHNAVRWVRSKSAGTRA